MKRLLNLLFLAILMPISQYSQTSSSELKLPDYIPPSPTAYQLTKYGDVPVNESTGIANISIPLFNYGTENILVPISLSYSSSGVKVDQVASNVGMNWNLNAGGVITRITRGLVDDIAVGTFNKSLSTVEADKTAGSDDFYNFVNDVNNTNTQDWQPDLFSFSIGGYSGSFFIDTNGDPVLTKRDSEIKIEVVSGGNGFKIITPNGISYTFDEREQTKQSSSGLPTPSSMSDTSYFLTKIDHFSGDQITIEYESLQNDLVYMSSISQTETYITDKSLECQNSPTFSISKQVNYSYVDQKKIKKISSNRNIGYVEFSTAENRSDMLNAYKVDKVRLYNDNDELIKGYSLDYTFYKSTKLYSTGAKTWTQINNLSSDHQNYYRMFLTGVNELDQNESTTNGRKYTFTYDSPTDLPPRLSTAQDHLGFYNGEDSNAGMLPDNFLVNHSHFDMSRRGDRSSDFTFAQKGLLTKVTYPTGGTTTLEYQGESYPVIKQINTRESASAPEKTTKYYYVSYQNVNSGGTTVSYHTYAPGYNDIIYDEYICQGCGWHNVMRFHSSSITNLYTTNENQFLFEKVTVVYGNNIEGGAVEKQFIVDSENNGLQLHGNLVRTGPKTNEALLNGTILKETILENTANGLTPVRDVTYTYATDTTKSISIDSYKGNIRYENAAVNQPGSAAAYQVTGYDLTHYETRSDWHSIESVTTNEYFDTGTVTTLKEYSYDSKLAGLPTSIKTSTSDGLDVLQSTVYANDITSKSNITGPDLTDDAYNAVTAMQTDSWNRIATVIQSEVYKDSNDDGSVDISELLSFQRTNYLKDLVNANLVQVENVQTNIGTSTLEDRIVYHEYDAEGKVLRVSKKDGTQVYFVWGYDNQKVIAKIENAPATFTTTQNTKISEAIMASDLDISMTTEATLILELEELRISFPRAKITTFTYDPLIGVTSVTDMRGYTTYYEYDSFNRLLQIKDDEGSILNYYEYNYKTQE